MPYSIVSAVKDGKVVYAVKNTKTGKLHGYTTKDKAHAQMRLLYMIDREKE